MKTDTAKGQTKPPRTARRRKVPAPVYENGVLRVFYDPVKCDWDEQIRRAKEHYGLQDKPIRVIAAPYNGEEG